MTMQNAPRPPRLFSGFLLIALAHRAAASSFLGCFKDTRDGQVLLSNKQTFDDLSPNVCEQHCLGRSLPLFGLQNGDECWCGSDDITFGTDDEEGSQFCDLECSGDSDLICGGSSSLSLYKTEAFTVHAHKPELFELASSAVYLGCFADDKNDRVLDSVAAASDVTPEACVEYCANLGQPLSGTQDGHECWCGDSDIPAWANIYDRHGPGNCNSVCSGDPGLLCGGVFSLSLYETSDAQGACNPNPCLNGGACNVDPAGGHICTCASGYGGMSCQTDTSGLAEFYIDVLDHSASNPFELSDAQRARLDSAVARWGEVITHVPCGGDEENPAGRVHITLTTIFWNGGFPYTLTSRDRYWLACDITADGKLSLDVPAATDLADDQFEELIFHEIGHILGIGYGWDKCTAGCTRDGVSEWGCPSAAAAYNDLAGNEQGTPALIVSTADGFLNCDHFTTAVISAEAMAPMISTLERLPLSKITVAALEDLGYIVDPSKAEPYVLPV